MAGGSYNNRYRVPTRQLLMGNVIWEGSALVGNVRSFTGIESRRKPDPLDTTIAQWRIVKDNPTIYSTVVNGSGREGPVGFVYPSTLPVTTYLDPPDREAVVSRATRRFVSNTGLGITLIESPQSVRMIGRRASQFYQAVRLLGKGKFGDFAHLMRKSTGYNISKRQIRSAERRFGSGRYSEKRASAAWLEFSFGWAPFFSSVFDSVEHALNYQRANSHRRSAKVGNARAGFNAHITNHRVYSAARLGLTNPLEIAWDRQPLSFVIDWFLPISTMLRIAAANHGLGKIYGYYSYKSGYTSTIQGIWSTESETYYRFTQHFGYSNVLVSPSNSLWRSITALALLSSLT